MNLNFEFALRAHPTAVIPSEAHEARVRVVEGSPAPTAALRKNGSAE
ncbi:MAG: hypothetical protein LBF67_02760 [Prevotellaceae bacterium]|nr:hypothetical protein [Prevotellaceae bacterium]